MVGINDANILRVEAVQGGITADTVSQAAGLDIELSAECGTGVMGQSYSVHIVVRNLSKATVFPPIPADTGNIGDAASTWGGTSGRVVIPFPVTAAVMFGQTDPDDVLEILGVVRTGLGANADVSFERSSPILVTV